jgi:predicted nuclease of predicted toxin-antitoxin system
MARFLIDADLPRSLARQLRAAGFEVEDVRDIGLRKSPDDDIFTYAVSHALVLLSGDLDFGNILRFPLGSHPGIVVARFPNEVPTTKVNAAILQAVQSLSGEDIVGNLIIVEPGRIRLRKQDRA